MLFLKITDVKSDQKNPKNSIKLSIFTGYFYKNYILGLKAVINDRFWSNNKLDKISLLFPSKKSYLKSFLIHN
jgi:hypothetical protein